MRDSFSQALANISQKAAGWASTDNLRRLSAPAADEVAAFTQVWQDLSEADRFQLADALADVAEVYEETSFEPLLMVMLEDESAEVRSAAVAGLAEAVDPLLAERLIMVLTTDPEAEVRAEAASALGEFLFECESEPQAGGTRRRVEDALLETINTDSEDVLVRRRALESYAYAEDPYTDDVLMESYESDEDEMRASAVFAMGRRLDEDWLAIIHREMDNEVEEIRLAAIFAAGEIGSGASIPFLLRVIGEDPSEDVRVTAVYSLADIESPEAERLLRDLMESNDEAILAAATDALDMWNARQDLGEMLMFDYGPEGDDEDDWADEDEDL